MPPMIGQITLFPYEYAPEGWLFCHGAILPISENKRLFQIIGNTYGGDGTTTFAVPDLRVAAPENCHYCISLAGTSGTNIYEGVIGETLPLPKSMAASYLLTKILPCLRCSVPGLAEMVEEYSACPICAALCRWQTIITTSAAPAIFQAGPENPPSVFLLFIFIVQSRKPIELPTS